MKANKSFKQNKNSLLRSTPQLYSTIFSLKQALEHSQIIYLFPHNEKWKSEFENEKNSIISIYEDEIEIFHIVSTAIKWLYAKGCIDLLGVVKNISKILALKQSIINLGYVYKGEFGISGREYFSKKQRKVHFHIFQAGDENVVKYLNFGKVMKGNLELISELNQIKQNLHAKYQNNK